MPKFKCINPECLFLEQVKDEGTATYKFIEGKLRAIEAVCPSCNQEREEIIVNKTYEPPTYEAVGMNSNRRNWSKGGNTTYY
jgi:hypothetical protein